MDWRTLDSLARAIVADDMSLVLEVLREQEDLPVQECEHCDDLCHTDDMCDVEGEQWCSHCVDYDAYYWDRDGELHREPEPDENEYPDYHSQRKRPGFRGACRIEIELEFHDEPSDVMHAAENADVLIEQDSSLSRDNSAEAITHPFKLDRDGLRKLGGLAEFLDSVRCGGWERRNYGIHVNLDRGNYTRFDVGRAMRFLAQNAYVVSQICGRDHVYNGGRGLAIGDCCPAYASIRDDRLGVKYATVNLCPGRIEFRIFQSNAKPEAVRKYVRFSRDVLEFGRIGGHRGTWSQFAERYPEWSTFQPVEVA